MLNTIDQLFEKIKQNAEISSRLISKQMDNVTQKKLATTRQLIDNIMNTIEGKNNSKSISSNELILTLETKEKELITRLHALEDVNAKSALELKQLITKYEMEKDINQRLLWRIQRYINNGSDNSKNNTSSGSSSSFSSSPYPVFVVVCLSGVCRNLSVARLKQTTENRQAQKN